MNKSKHLVYLMLALGAGGVFLACTVEDIPADKKIPISKLDGGSIKKDAGIDASSDASPECIKAACVNYNANCGYIDDNCGDRIYCGDCLDTQVCGGGGQNICGTKPCVSNTCAGLGASCGTPSNGCGDLLFCGACNAPETCGGGGNPSACGCTPETDVQFCARQLKTCGAVSALDNCGKQRAVASCGVCVAPQTCGATNTCACVPETNPAFCLRLGKTCGTVGPVADNCAVLRTVVSCGTCVAGATCNAGNTCNACVPETDAAICNRLAHDCGPLGPVIDNCGTPNRMVVSCGSCPGMKVCDPNGTCK